MTVRSITDDELDLFASLSGSADARERFMKWVEDRWRTDESRPSWCFLLERGTQAVGRLLYWSFPSHRDDLVLAGLQLPWEDDYRDAGRRLFLESLQAIRSEGATSLEASLAADLPSADRRREVIEAVPFPVVQQKRRFTLRGIERNDGAESRLAFRSMKETTRESFREMIERVTEGTLDRHDTEERRLHGAGRAAERYIEMLEEIDANTDLWQLAYDPREKCIGLVVPQRLDEERGTINYIGVVPEARGHGYVDDLMRRGIDLLHESRIDIVVADVDALNSPVIAALQRSGWIESGGSWRFDLRTAEQER